VSSSDVHIVDDEVGMAEEIASILAGQGIAARIFSNGAAFLSEYHPLDAPGCIIIDNGMLGMGGADVVVRIAKLGHPPPFILMARVDEPIDLPRVSPCHIRFLRKPFSAQQLLDLVGIALKQRRPRPNDTYSRFLELRRALDLQRRARETRPEPLAPLQSELEFRSGLLRVLDSAMQVGEAACGNVRLFNPARDGLEIRVQRGFPQISLEAFGCVRVDPTPCGRAFKQARQVLVNDALKDRGFRPYASIARRAGFRGVQSTPIRVDGYVVGTLSTHFAGEAELSPEDLSAIDLHATMAARLIAGHR
jgi:FixJ family two-component response regulator